MNRARLLRVVLPVLGVALLGTFVWSVRGGGAAPDGTVQLPPAPATLPKSLDDLRDRIGKTMERVGAVYEEALRHPSERLVQKYMNYSLDEMQKSRGREVDAETLIKILADSDPNLPFKVRESCVDALVAGARQLQDIDLSQDKKRGSMNNRAWFFKNKVVGLLDDSDQVTRKLAQRLLNEFYKSGGGDEDITGYNVDDKNTWGAAKRAWTKWLQRNG
ncbi:MAG: hypothetical protein R3F05_07530 [Planctomycetota bacterium]